MPATYTQAVADVFVPVWIELLSKLGVIPFKSLVHIDGWRVAEVATTGAQVKGSDRDQVRHVRSARSVRDDRLTYPYGLRATPPRPSDVCNMATLSVRVEEYRRLNLTKADDTWCPIAAMSQYGNQRCGRLSRGRRTHLRGAWVTDRRGPTG